MFQNLAVFSHPKEKAYRPMNEMNRLRHELAKAQSAFNLVGGGRQSRLAAWSTYSQLVAKTAQESVPAASQNCQVSQAIEEFIPSSVMRGGTRTYQVLALRRHACADLELALTERVSRE